jgi:hypothetical protein
LMPPPPPGAPRSPPMRAPLQRVPCGRRWQLRPRCSGRQAPSGPPSPWMSAACRSILASWGLSGALRRTLRSRRRVRLPVGEWAARSVTQYAPRARRQEAALRNRAQITTAQVSEVAEQRIESGLVAATAAVAGTPSHVCRLCVVRAYLGARCCSCARNVGLEALGERERAGLIAEAEVPACTHLRVRSVMMMREGVLAL